MIARELDRSESELLAEIRRALRAAIPAYVAGALIDGAWSAYCDLSAPGDGCPIPVWLRRGHDGD